MGICGPDTYGDSFVFLPKGKTVAKCWIAIPESFLTIHEVVLLEAKAVAKCLNASPVL